MIQITLPSGDTITCQLTVADDFVLGDVNLDRKVTAEDAAQMLLYAAARGAGKETQFNPENVAMYTADNEALEAKARRQADTNGDGLINAEDAANDLMYAAAVGAEGKADWDAILSKPDETTA